MRQRERDGIGGKLTMETCRTSNQFIEASPSFVREPEGNGVAERFIRTLKENLLWVRTFDTIEELRAALIEFATRYNETWLVARHGYRTPAEVRADQCRLDPNTTADLKLAA